MKTAVSSLCYGEKPALEDWADVLRAAIAPHPKVRELEHYANASLYSYRLADVKLRAIVEAEHHADGHFWAHLSVSAQSPARLATWKELRWAKEHFLGDRRAIMVLPPRSEYINIHPNVLNLYACLSGNPLPDFRMQDQVTGQVGI